MGDEAETGLRVGDALDECPYRVYPHTPLAEVMDLMVRKRLRAVPVVGESYEVMGILTSGDALGHVLRSGAPDQEAAEAAQGLARDLMTRTVLCISEDQPLDEAGSMLVNRDVEQLPVVREGRFVGFVTRDSVLAAMTGGGSHEDASNRPGSEGDT